MSNQQIITINQTALPALITQEGDRAAHRFMEFFAAQIRNPNTREAYARAVGRFLSWCDEQGITLSAIEPIAVAAYIELLQKQLSSPTVKQHLAAIRMCFDWLVTGQIIPMNPASSVRGPKHVVKKGKTPVLDGDAASALLNSISIGSPEDPDLVGLRDRALIGTMTYSFARISAAISLDVSDYYHNGRRGWLRLAEKGGKHHEVPCHHSLEELLDAYITAAGLEESKGPLFRTAFGRTGRLTENRMDRSAAWYMIKRRAKNSGTPLPPGICNHTFRGTGITAYLANDGQLEHAQQIAAHESARTTKLYDRRADEITLDEIEKIRL